jgi:hypothetical protein
MFIYKSLIYIIKDFRFGNTKLQNNAQSIILVFPHSALQISLMILTYT